MLSVLLAAWFLEGGRFGFAEEGEHEHENEQEQEHNRARGVAGEANQSDDGHEDHAGGVLELTPEAVRMAGIRLARADRGSIETSIHVPGEVGFNEDRLVHVVPRFAGIAHEVHFRMGDRVRSGDILAVLESNESLSKYAIAAPISGWIIEKDVTPGEFVSGDRPIYVIADLTHVWVNLAVYLKDVQKINPGQTVTLHAIGSDLSTEGTIEYITPILDPRTRSMTARIILPNPENSWRPGTFVHADIMAGRGEERLLVEKDAVQILDDEYVVFIPEGDASFNPVLVVVGESDSRFTEILAGLDSGMEYVAAGAFELKAKIVTGALGGHAGHGH
ncbi:MAG: efflux RND transporter periplasmic adaptor subunit [Candidatus Eisenbacteria bacterium]